MRTRLIRCCLCETEVVRSIGTEKEAKKNPQSPALPKNGSFCCVSFRELRQRRRRRIVIACTQETPALIQLAAEPLAALVDTAYLGRLAPEVLSGAGVAVRRIG